MARLFRDYQADLRRYLADELRPSSGDSAVVLAGALTARVSFGSGGRQAFSLSVCHEGVTGIRFDLWAALGAAVGLVAGIVGAHPVAATASVLACLIALRGVRRPVSDLEATLLYVLHCHDRASTVPRLVAAVQSRLPRGEGEIRDALEELKATNAIDVVRDRVTLNEFVDLTYTPLPPR